MKKFGFATFLTFLSCFGSLCADPYLSLPDQCDGFPQVALVTPDNLCVGLVIQKSSNVSLKKPRSLIELGANQLLVIDAGSWVPRQGALLLVDYSNQSQRITSLLNNLNLPHKILHGPNNYIYFSEADKISRFIWQNNAIQKMETVVDNLPFDASYLHPLKNFTFDRNGDLLVNIGSSSDRCENSQPGCRNGEEASIRRYPFDQINNQYSKHFSIVASGLRNSMGLVVHSSETILQAENSIDLPDADEPYEELNVIEQSKFYGWPECINANATITGKTATITGKTCSSPHYQSPWTLLPPHVAPLDLLYYQGDKIPLLKNKLIMSWHGFRIAGNRLVAYELDDHGRPLLQEKAIFRRAPLNEIDPYTEHVFAPKGGLNNNKNPKQKVAQHQEIISEWHAIQNIRPEGSPVGLTQSSDGSVWIVDDRNAAILRLSNGSAFQKNNLKIEPQIGSIAGPAVPPEVTILLKQRCSQCHSELSQHPDALLNANRWLKKENGRWLLEHKIFFDQTRPMPPNGDLTSSERDLLQNWLNHL
jgi:glucose/arabinose dehydrogenase